MDYPLSISPDSTILHSVRRQYPTWGPHILIHFFLSHFSDEEKKDALLRVVAPVKAAGVSVDRQAPGPAPVHSPVTLFASLLSPSASVSHKFGSPIQGPKRRGYLHVVQTSGYNTGKSTGATVRVNGNVSLAEGDGLYIVASEGDQVEIENVGDRTAELLLFDLD